MLVSTWRRLRTGSAVERIDTVGDTYVTIFDIPGCRNPSRDDSRQYEEPYSETRAKDTLTIDYSVLPVDDFGPLAGMD